MAIEGRDWLKLIPVVGGVSLLIHLTLSALRSSKGTPEGKAKINLSIQKDKPKVRDVVDVEELGQKTSYCRCWRSAKWPLCDGAHKKHNEETGDNVGPLVIERKSAEK